MMREENVHQYCTPGLGKNISATKTYCIYYILAINVFLFVFVVKGAIKNT